MPSAACNHTGLLLLLLRWFCASDMAPRLLLAAVALLLVSPLLPAVGATDILESVPDLEKAMYLNVESYPCVRLLNLSGEIGCSNPGHEKVIAPITKLESTDDQLTRLSAILLPLEEMQNFFLRVSSNPDFARKIAGVLVDSSGYKNKSLGFSPVEKFPQAQFAPYRNLNYEWNPAGSGIMWNHYNFPVFLLSGESTLIIKELAKKNVRSGDAYPVNVAEFDLVMQTTASGTHDSESCLREKSCLPLGGYSVWSSLPPINVSSTKPPKPILMAVASQDSASFFRDQSLGADSPISGLIALLTAVDALSHVDGLDKLKKQLVFVVFTGEAWGYLGSRKFLLELDVGADAVKGLNSTMIEQVLEIGSVGKGLGQGSKTFFAHADGMHNMFSFIHERLSSRACRTDPVQEASSVTKEMLNAFQAASDSLVSDNVTVKKANTSNPGIPPSSLMAFLRKNSSTSGVVLEDFDSSFTNKFYHSHLDNPSNVDSSSIAAAAALVARALYILASGDSTVDLMALNSIKVNVSLVEELVRCLLTCEPGLSCGIVKNFISPSNNCPSHYVGVFLGSPSDTQNPEYADDTSRFVWNFLADRTSTPKDNASSCTGGCSNLGEICVGAEIAGSDRCMISTTRYVPAYSTRLTFKDESWHVLPADSSDPMGSVDPVWTESFWNAIGLQVYTLQSATYDRFILIAGVGITVASYIAIVVSKGCLSKALKHD